MKCSEDRSEIGRSTCAGGLPAARRAKLFPVGCFSGFLHHLRCLSHSCIVSAHDQKIRLAFRQIGAQNFTHQSPDRGIYL